MQSKYNAVEASDLQNLVSLTEPDADHAESVIYINQISKVKYNGKLVLLVQGNFPNGCAQLLGANHKIIDSGTFRIELTGWKPTDRMCTQALVPFSYIYDQISAEEIQKLDSYLIEGRRYDF
ncbi:MAG: hypothetical protein ACQETE_04745 [Bacteroidota bacterium]